MLTNMLASQLWQRASYHMIFVLNISLWLTVDSTVVCFIMYVVVTEWKVKGSADLTVTLFSKILLNPKGFKTDRKQQSFNLH